MPSRRSYLAILAAGLTGCSTGPGTGSTSREPRDPQSTRPPTSDGDDETPDDGTRDEPTDEPPTGDAVRWTYRLDGPVTETPVLRDGTLYVAGGANDRETPPDGGGTVRPPTSQNLVALTADGSERWRYEASAGVSGPVPTAGGVYVVVGWDAGLHGVDQRVVRVEDGQRRWSSEKTAEWLTILTTEDERAYVGTGDDARGTTGESLFSLAPDGTERWRVESGDANAGAVHDGTLYVSLAGMQTVAYDVADGGVRWRHSSAPVAYGSLRVYDDALYLGAEREDEDGDYPLLSVAASDWSVRWRYAGGDTDHDPGSPFLATGAVERDGVVYGTEYSGLAFALDAADGSELWSRDLAADVRDPPVLAGDALVVPGFNRTLQAFDATTGERRWTRTLGGVPRRLVATDDALVVGTGGKGSTSVLAFAHDGSPLWEFTHPGGVLGPAVDGTAAYVGTEGGYVARLGP